MTILTDVPSATARSQFSMMHRLHSLSTSTTTERRRRANNFYCTTIEDHTSISTRNEPSGTTVLYFNNFLLRHFRGFLDPRLVPMLGSHELGFDERARQRPFQPNKDGFLELKIRVISQHHITDMIYRTADREHRLPTDIVCGEIYRQRRRWKVFALECDIWESIYYQETSVLTDDSWFLELHVYQRPACR